MKEKLIDSGKTNFNNFLNEVDKIKFKLSNYSFHVITSDRQLLNPPIPLSTFLNRIIQNFYNYSSVSSIRKKEYYMNKIFEGQYFDSDFYLSRQDSIRSGSIKTVDSIITNYLLNYKYELLNKPANNNVEFRLNKQTKILLQNELYHEIISNSFYDDYKDSLKAYLIALFEDYANQVPINREKYMYPHVQTIYKALINKKRLHIWIRFENKISKCYFYPYRLIESKSGKHILLAGFSRKIVDGKLTSKRVTTIPLFEIEKVHILYSKSGRVTSKEKIIIKESIKNKQQTSANVNRKV